MPAQPAPGKAPSPNGTPQAKNVPDEDASFFAAVRDVKPLAGKGREVAAETPPLPQQVQAPGNPLQEFMEGKLEFALAFTDEYVEGHVLGLDLLTVGKLQAGQFSPESHLDLHGMNAQQAFEALVGFFRAAYFKGQRTVLVVPGRGRNSPHGVPILREKVQEWFTQDPFKRVILAFCTARPADGGAGA
ncbi:MAG TPA: Smr/MutS family protein, partial [Candidatus Bilophila faecipullorum]|nr:Smr/MutS family protein [Candidatus Bilophila faecipullorum]